MPESAMLIYANSLNQGSYAAMANNALNVAETTVKSDLTGYVKKSTKGDTTITSSNATGTASSTLKLTSAGLVAVDGNMVLYVKAAGDNYNVYSTGKIECWGSGVSAGSITFPTEVDFGEAPNVLISGDAAGTVSAITTSGFTLAGSGTAYNWYAFGTE